MGVDAWKSLEQCMRRFGLEGAVLQEVWDICSGILFLGNLTSQGDTFSISTKPMTDLLLEVSRWWRVPVQTLRAYLETHNLYVNREVVNMPFSVHDGAINRDALVKYTYDQLFQWIVRRINRTTSPAKVDDAPWIGILDVFGFESFDVNSFEQFCINLTNEKLQNFFNRYILQSEQDEYLREAILWHPVEVQDNSDTLELLEGRPSGILSLLDSACVMPQGTPKIWVENIFALHRQHPRLKKPHARAGPMSFSIMHYADSVMYSATDFLHKNNDSQNVDLFKLLASSELSIFKELGTAGTATKGGAKFSSVSRVFQQQLAALMQTLQSTTPFFIRCVNPNPRQSSGDFDTRYVQPQIRMGGLLQAVEMLKYGYPFRLSYSLLAGPLIPRLFPRFIPYALDAKPVFARNICEGLVHHFAPRSSAASCQLGLTKIFFKTVTSPHEGGSFVSTYL